MLCQKIIKIPIIKKAKGKNQRANVLDFNGGFKDLYDDFCKESQNELFETKEEAIYVTDEIEKLLLKKIHHNEIAILFRVAAHTRSFEDRFINLGLPYKIIGGLRFYERKEIRDIIAYL